MTKKEKLEKAIQLGISIANNNNYGYRNVPGNNYGQNGQFDCGGFISYCLAQVGILNQGVMFEPNEEYGNSWSYGTVLEAAGFKKYAFNAATAQRGDILIRDGHHTEWYLGDGTNVGAHWDYDGVNGDSSGSEINIAGMGSNWDYMYRLADSGSGSGGTSEKTVTGTYVEYRVMEDINKRWLEAVKNDTDYAGIIGHDVDNVCIRLSNGKKVHYCVHLWSGDDQEHYGNAKWLPDVTGYDPNEGENGYAGDNRPIDALAVYSTKKIKYRVHLRKTNKWLPWVSSENYNTEDSENGYAGIIGQPIDAIQLKA